MYAIVPISEPVEVIERDIKDTDTICDTCDTNSSHVEDKLSLNCHKGPMKATRNSYGEDSGFDDLFESEATEKTGLLSESSDSTSPDAAHLDKDSPINGIDESGISNYHEYATALTDVRKEVDKKDIGKKKKVRINEDITDISLIPDRFEYCVNYKNGYNGYTQEEHSSGKNISRNNKNKCYYRYCFDTQNSGQHYTAKWEEEDGRLSYYR